MGLEKEIKGDLARLFPALDVSQKENRALSIFLYVLSHVKEFGAAMLYTVDKKVGARTKLAAYTEITFPKDKDGKGDQPDGLVIAAKGNQQWSAMFEAKIGNAKIDPSQIERYLKLARRNGVDALISISNEFAVIPSHPPYRVSGMLTRTVHLYHWSWKNILTQAAILADNEAVEDEDQALILKEFVRFLGHKATDIRGMDHMGSSWSDLISCFQNAVHLKTSDEKVQETASRWLEEVRDLQLILSRRTATHVQLREPRSHAKDPAKRQKDTCGNLVDSGCLRAAFQIPDAVNDLEIEADLAHRSLRVWMQINAPQDKKQPRACIRWLLRQFVKIQFDQIKAWDIQIRADFPGRVDSIQEKLEDVKQDPDILLHSGRNELPKAFRIIFVNGDGRAFRQPKNFIVMLENAVPDFYGEVGQNLQSWQAPAPKIRQVEEPQEPRPVLEE